MNDYEQISKDIVSWIKNKVDESNSKGIVLGLSGGVDSAVVAALAVQAVGRQNVLCVMMPCRGSEQDIIDAKLLAKKFELRPITVDLFNTYDILETKCNNLIAKVVELEKRLELHNEYLSPKTTLEQTIAATVSGIDLKEFWKS